MSSAAGAGGELALNSCPMCGAEATPSDTECGECGERLPRQRAVYRPAEDLPDHSVQKRVLGVLLLLISLPVLAAGLIGAFLTADPMGRVMLTAAAFPGGFGIWNSLPLILKGRGAKMHRWREESTRAVERAE